MHSDPENPIVQINYPFVHGIQFEDVVIPCKPTSKKVQLELIKDGDVVSYLFALKLISNFHFG